MKTDPEITVIVPVFKVSSYIERCAEALMQQTFRDVEFIFVDDASPDDSREKLEAVIRKYPGRDVTILTHEHNMGLPASRKTGFEAARGRYIYQCDADDWVENDILEKMHAAAVESGADFIYCDFWLTFEKNERYMHTPAYSSPDEMLRRGFLSGNCKYNWWNKLMDRKLYAGVEFPVDHKKGGEDMVVIGMLSRARKVAHVPEALYHYVKTNSGAISEGFSERRLRDIRYNADSAISVLKDYPGDLNTETALFKLNVKLPFLISGDIRKYQIWKEWYPEANSFIFRNTELPMRTKVLQWCASKDLWMLVRLYYLLVYRTIYGLVYR